MLHLLGGSTICWVGRHIVVWGPCHMCGRQGICAGLGSTHGYPSTGIFLYFQILTTYFWLDLYVLRDFFCTCKCSSPEFSKYFRSTKNLYVCEWFLKQIQHILCTPVTMVRPRILLATSHRPPCRHHTSGRQGLANTRISTGYARNLPDDWQVGLGGRARISVGPWLTLPRFRGLPEEFPL